MSAVTVSPKFQIVIPKDAREFLHLKPGQKLEVIISGEHLSLVPVVDVKSLRGSLKGIAAHFKRDKDRF